jgi:hypothetical protein
MRLHIIIRYVMQQLRKSSGLPPSRNPTRSLMIRCLASIKTRASGRRLERAHAAQSDAEPTATRALLREARPYVASAKGDDTETHNFVDGLLRDIDAALAQSDAEPDDPLPREHQDPSKWPTRETVERAHAAQSDAEPVICPNCGLSVWQTLLAPPSRNPTRGRSRGVGNGQIAGFGLQQGTSYMRTM